MATDNLTHLAAFAAVARHRSFRRAGAELALSTSAVSYAIRALEERLGVGLFHRTTRSVSLTEAGQRLMERLQPALGQVSDALEEMNQFRATPAGLLRINAARAAVPTQLSPRLADFLRVHPDVRIEVTENDGLVDIVAEGFDAGVRLHEFVPEDMVAVPLGPSLRGMIVASPAYLAQHQTPQHPRDLLRHQCVRFRFASGHLYKWQFERGEESLEIDVQGPDHPERADHHRARRAGRARHCLRAGRCRAPVAGFRAAGQHAGGLESAVPGVRAVLPAAAADDIGAAGVRGSAARDVNGVNALPASGSGPAPASWMASARRALPYTG
jgi:DNA-binding transcriptional LysR family regulator